MSAEKKYIVVTEKDAVKLRELTTMDKSIRKALLYIPIEVEFLGDRKLFEKRVLKYIKKASA
jgi:tetraacyldisaccharide-1-P 4'-kinase